MALCVKCGKIFKKSGGKGCREKFCHDCWIKSRSASGKKGAQMRILNTIERRSREDARI